MKKAQDKIISLFLAPMKKKNARLKAENKRREIEQAEYQAEYEAALKAGRCVAQYGVECSCVECEKHSRAYDAIDNKEPDITAYEALIKDGFNNQDARAQVEIFDDLGIFDEKELFCKNSKNRGLKGQ